jgi:ADP-ribosyl-[dinitrogen reductase] hydrolase
MSSKELSDRARGALYGAFIGDALAMPVHWYYETNKLAADYGEVTDYVAPKNPHTDSFMDSASYTPPNKKADILHDQAKWWGKKGIHYHQFLEAGENTLNLQLANEVRKGLNEDRGYIVEKQLQRYIDFLRTPGMHRDTYVEGAHTHFFVEYSQGRHPMHCSKDGENHGGGLVALIPILAYYRDNPEAGRIASAQHLQLTHLGEQMTLGRNFLCDVLAQLFAGESLSNVLEGQSKSNSMLNFPFHSMLELDDHAVVGGNFKTSCTINQSIPGLTYLAMKYGDTPETALIRNTNLGGDNCHRGAILGALLGAAHGMSAWPKKWVDGLKTSLD